MSVLSLAQQHQTAILRRDAHAAQQITATWQDSVARLLARLHGLFGAMQNAEQLGQEVNVGWLVEANRLQQALDAVQTEAQQFSSSADAQVQAQTNVAHATGQADAHLLLQHQLGKPGVQFHRPMPQAGAALAVSLDSGPIARRFAQMPPAAVKSAKGTLLAGIASGQGPRQIASRLRYDLSSQLSDALRIARTESMQAYRTGSLSTYQANSDVVTGWDWLAEPDACDFCLSMNGKHFSISDSLDSHPNCRCTMLPTTKGYDEILAA